MSTNYTSAQQQKKWTKKESSVVIDPAPYFKVKFDEENYIPTVMPSDRLLPVDIKNMVFHFIMGSVHNQGKHNLQFCLWCGRLTDNTHVIQCEVMHYPPIMHGLGINPGANFTALGPVCEKELPLAMMAAEHQDLGNLIGSEVYREDISLEEYEKYKPDSNKMNKCIWYLKTF
jgi:hypothetical protein